MSCSCAAFSERLLANKELMVSSDVTGQNDPESFIDLVTSHQLDVMNDRQTAGQNLKDLWKMIPVSL